MNCFKQFTKRSYFLLYQGSIKCNCKQQTNIWPLSISMNNDSFPLGLVIIEFPSLYSLFPASPRHHPLTYTPTWIIMEKFRQLFSWQCLYLHNYLQCRTSIFISFDLPRSSSDWKDNVQRGIPPPLRIWISVCRCGYKGHGKTSLFPIQCQIYKRNSLSLVELNLFLPHSNW